MPETSVPSLASFDWASLGAGGVFLYVFPFAFLLLSIAFLPLHPRASHWWENHLHKLVLAAACAVVGVALFIARTGDWARVGHSYLEYAAFLALLASLFVISGGIRIGGSFAGFPYVNTIFLGIGAILANFLGTTGASMLLIRPLLHANRKRQHKTHIVVFFIFIVANCGGLLTPLGDPPLYLGFLRGVPFDWTFQLSKEWGFTIFTLLFIFHLVDERQFNKEDLETKGSLVDDVATSQRRLHLDGFPNLALLVGVVLCILVSGYWIQPSLTASHGAGVADWGSKLFQILAMGTLTFVSLRITPKALHQANHFSFEPILEVAALFFGIFGAMIPALAILEAKGPALPLTEAWHYFWATGLLSGFLDNAPTYLTFVTMAAARFGVDTTHLGELAAGHSDFLAAISCGAVFMGAITYIGNGPNFMVKALAEHAKVRMPSFGGYLLWSLVVLVPLFIVQTFLFF